MAARNRAKGLALGLLLTGSILAPAALVEASHNQVNATLWLCTPMTLNGWPTVVVAGSSVPARVTFCTKPNGGTVTYNGILSDCQPNDTGCTKSPLATFSKTVPASNFQNTNTVSLSFGAGPEARRAVFAYIRAGSVSHTSYDAWAHQDLLVDGTPPTTTHSVFQGTLRNGWYTTSPVGISLRATDNFLECGVKASFPIVDNGPPGSSPFYVFGDGRHTIQYYSEDCVSNVEPRQGPFDIPIDATPPQVAVEQPVCQDDDFRFSSNFCRGPVSIAATASDATSGLQSLVCRLDGVVTGCAITVFAEGTHTFTATATDNAGHAVTVSPGTGCTACTFGVDTRAPLVALTLRCLVPGTLGFCRSPSFDYAASSSDPAPGSGIAAGQPQCFVDGASAPCPAGSVGGQGFHVVEATVLDKAGNGAQDAKSLTIDSVPPVVDLQLFCASPGTPSWCRSPSFEYQGSSFDPAPGELAAGQPTCTVDGRAASCAGSVAGEGVHTVAIRSLDRAGNPNSDARALAIDSVPPVVALVPSCAAPGGDGFCRQPVKVAVQASDATSGINVLSCTVDGLARSCAALEVAEEGAHLVQAFAEDVAGNQARAGVVANVDRTPPVLDFKTFCTLEGEVGSGFCRGEIRYEVTAQDATSGVGSIACKVDGASAPCSGTIRGDGPHRLEAAASDVAGNNAAQSADFQVDATPPVVGIRILPLPLNLGAYVVEVRAEDAVSKLTGDLVVQRQSNLGAPLVGTEFETVKGFVVPPRTAVFTDQFVEFPSSGLYCYRGTVKDVAGNRATSFAPGLQDVLGAVDLSDPTDRSEAERVLSGLAAACTVTV